MLIGHDDVLAGRRRKSGMEGITLTLANAPYDIINRSTCIVGGTKGGYDTKYCFDGYSLATAIVTSLEHGKAGLACFDPLTKKESIMRIYVAGIRCDSVMVRIEINFIYFISYSLLSPII